MLGRRCNPNFKIHLLACIVALTELISVEGRLYIDRTLIMSVLTVPGDWDRPVSILLHCCCISVKDLYLGGAYYSRPQGGCGCQRLY